MSICPSSTFIPIGNGRSALFTILVSRRSFLRRRQTKRLLSRTQPRPPTSLRGGESGRHSLRCERPNRTSYNHLIRKGENRSCNAKAKSQSAAPHRRWFRWRGKPSSVGFATASGERAAVASLERASCIVSCARPTDFSQPYGAIRNQIAVAESTKSHTSESQKNTSPRSMIRFCQVISDGC